MPIVSYHTELIFKNKKDKNLVLSTLQLERKFFNICSKRHFKSKTNSIVELHSKCYRFIRNKFPNSPSQIIIRAEHECLAVYKGNKKCGHILKKYPVKRKLSLRLDKRLYSFKNDVFRITTIKGRVSCQYKKYPKIIELMSKYKIGDPLIFERNSKVYISFNFSIPDYNIVTNKVLGVDLGISRIATTSEGNILQDKIFNGKKRKIRFLKRRLESKHSKSSKKHFKKIRHKEQNLNKELCRKLACKIVKSTNSNTIAIEDLRDIKQKKGKIKKYRNLNKISQMPFYLIRQCLIHKALLSNKKVITVNPRFTSQIDCETGKRSGIRKGCRFYSESGKVFDSDINAAINIANRSKLPISIGNYLDGQAIVIKPIVGLNS